MISGEDIEAFRAESEPAFEEGRKFVRRCAKGIPADRWTTTAGMQLVAECINGVFITSTLAPNLG